SSARRAGASERWLAKPAARSTPPKRADCGSRGRAAYCSISRSAFALVNRRSDRVRCPTLTRRHVGMEGMTSWPAPGGSSATQGKDAASMKIRLSELARAYEGQLQGDGSVEITGVASLRNAGPGDITLIEGPSYLRFLADCRAAAVIGPPNLVPPDMPAILTQDCRAVFEKIVRQFRPLPTSTTRGISPRAEIHPTARLGKDVTIHARATIGAEVTIGDNTTIHAGCVILDGCSIGADCTILPNTVL